MWSLLAIYSQQRSKLVSNLLKMPSIETEGEDPIGSIDVNEINLKDNLMSILSPNSLNSSTDQQTSQCLNIHNPRTLLIHGKALLRCQLRVHIFLSLL